MKFNTEQKLLMKYSYNENVVYLQKIIEYTH